MMQNFSPLFKTENSYSLRGWSDKLVLTFGFTAELRMSAFIGGHKFVSPLITKLSFSLTC